MDRGRIHTAPLASDDTQAYEAVVKLSNRFIDRLGQLPYAAFEEARDESRILVATDQDTHTVVGYALYRLPRNEVSLTHLCVEPDARGTGVARALVDRITELHCQRLGIRAKCRDDYGLADTWTRLGFTARAKATGRGQDRAPMTVWWKNHGHPDLFTEYELPVELQAAIDLNIVRDLASPAKRKHRSDFLTADHLAGRLQLVVSSGMLAEINEGDPARRAPLLKEVSSYPVINADPQRAEELQQRILEEVQRTTPNYPTTDQDRRDVLQVAHAAAAGLSVFLTWDDGLIKRLGPVIEALTGSKLMTPPYVVVHLDEIANAEAFRLDSLAGSAFTHARAGAALERELDVFIADTSGERRQHLRDHVSKLIQAGCAPRVVRDEHGTAVALYCAFQAGTAWRVPLLRLANHVMADTLARHLLWTFRLHARDAEASLVDIADPHLSPRLTQAASFESLLHVDTHWYAPVIDVCGDAADVHAETARTFDAAGLTSPPLLRPGLSKQVAATVEHAWWPAKILDSELPTYAVPIRANYAYELFGYPEGLSGRNPQLSLGREHVYYHSAVNSQLTAPARVLWLSTGEGPGVSHFFAASTLDSIMIDTPERLYENLSYYGVFNRDAVKKAAMGHGTAEALRLSDTEVFRTPISFRQYLEQRETIGDGPKALMSAQRIPTALFASLYHMATK